MCRQGLTGIGPTILTDLAGGVDAAGSAQDLGRIQARAEAVAAGNAAEQRQQVANAGDAERQTLRMVGTASGRTFTCGWRIGRRHSRALHGVVAIRGEERQPVVAFIPFS